MFKLREHQRRRLDNLESLPMLGAHAHRDDVVRSAEDDRENAKQKAKSHQAPRGRTRHVGCLPTVAHPSFAISPFRAFAILFPKASHDVQVEGTPAAET
jgi:hypothetical protein